MKRLKRKMEKKLSLTQLIDPTKVVFISVAEAQAGLARMLRLLPDEEWTVFIMKNNKAIGMMRKYNETSPQDLERLIPESESSGEVSQETPSI